MSKSDLLESASSILTTLGAGLDDEEVITRLADRIAAYGGGARLASQLTQSGQQQAETLSLYRWAEGGFPVVTMGHRFAAALALTTATDEVVDAARPPFPGYLIEVPDGTVSMVDPDRDDASLEAIRFILVARNDNKKTPLGWSWAYNAISEKHHVIYRYGVTSRELLPPDLVDDVLEGGRIKDEPRTVTDTRALPKSMLVTDHDRRSSAIVGRLIVNTALAMSDPRNVTEQRAGRVRHRVNSAFGTRRAPEPVCRTYVLGRDLQLSTDLRPELRRYLSGERRSPSVQVLVSGHYKMQPHGPQNSLRKLIWREPFWRGPEDAPIPIRSHAFGDRPR